MLAKRHRLSRRDVETLKLAGNKKKIQNALLIYLDIGDPVRFGVSISKKVVRNAVDRNRIRRQIFARIRLHPAYCNGKSAKSVLIKLQKNLADSSEFDTLIENVFEI